MILILGESLLAIKLNIIINPAHILFISEEKMLSERLQKPEQFPLVLGSLRLLQPRATTVRSK